MCATKQGFPTGRESWASRAALVFFVFFASGFVLEPIQREPAKCFAPSCGGISTLFYYFLLK